MLLFICKFHSHCNIDKTKLFSLSLFLIFFLCHWIIVSASRYDAQKRTLFFYLFFHSSFVFLCIIDWLKDDFFCIFYCFRSACSSSFFFSVPLELQLDFSIVLSQQRKLIYLSLFRFNSKIISRFSFYYCVEQTKQQQ